MASTVTWDQLRELARFRAQNGCAISLYLDLDPSDTPTPDVAATRVNALIDEIERSEAARRPELTHEQKEGLRKDVERLRSFLRERVRPRGLPRVRGLLRATRQRLAAYVAERTRARPGQGRTEPPSRAAGSACRPGEGALVAVVSRERGDLYRLHESRLRRSSSSSRSSRGATTRAAGRNPAISATSRSWCTTT